MSRLDAIDRVRAHSAPEINRKIDLQTEASLRFHATTSKEEITRRIDELEREWDTERVLITNASALALTGLALGLLRDRRWFFLPGLVLPFLFQHAVQGWCPPLPVIRRFFGVRTRREIDVEKYALKALRGDFGETLPESADLSVRVQRALDAARQ
jgi:hypothetical protein